MITAASSHKELAQAFLEYMVEPQTQKLVTDVTHYTPANPATAQLLTPDEVKSLHLDDPDAYMKRIYFWQDVPRRAEIHRNLERGEERAVSSPVTNAHSATSGASGVLLAVRGIAKRFGEKEVLKSLSLEYRAPANSSRCSVRAAPAKPRYCG